MRFSIHRLMGSFAVLAASLVVLVPWLGLRRQIESEEAIDAIVAKGAEVQARTRDPEWLHQIPKPFQPLVQKLFQCTEYNVYPHAAAIDDEYLAQLAKLTNPTRLDLTFHHGITNQSVGSLARFQSLQELNISGTKITSTGLLALRQALPKCKIVTHSLPNGGLIVDPRELNFGTELRWSAFEWKFKVRNPGPEAFEFQISGFG